jgi:hypothetical protein
MSGHEAGRWDVGGGTGGEREGQGVSESRTRDSDSGQDRSVSRGPQVERKQYQNHHLNLTLFQRFQQTALQGLTQTAGVSVLPTMRQPRRQGARLYFLLLTC